ncbi:MAG: SpoIID/LytB domain-containing protein [Elusimicrobiota bacterium]
MTCASATQHRATQHTNKFISATKIAYSMTIFKKTDFYFLLFIFYFIFCTFFTSCTVPKRLSPAIEHPTTVDIINEIKPTEQKKETIVKIGIIENTDNILVSIEDDFEIIDIKTDEKTKMSANVYSANVAKQGIIFGKEQFFNDIKIIQSSVSTTKQISCSQDDEIVIKKSDKKISINGKKYRGNIILKISNGKKLTVINELYLEEYVCGVMTKEVSPTWFPESLKAQAVVARTYAIKNLGLHGSHGFDLCPQTHCQVYGGFNSEDERTNKAVYDTAGEVLKYEGVIANTFYHSSCGGRTEGVRNVWNCSATKNPEYLTGVKCGFCKQDKWCNWSASVSLKTIGHNLQSFGYKIGDVKRIKLVGRTSSNRVKEILVEHSKGKLWLLANRFRLVINPNIVRSTNFTIKIKNNIVYFRGHGWGHGVGMCQWGAKGMAENGWDYKKILEHYYHDTEIDKN